MGVHYDDMPDHDGYTRRTAAGLLSVCSCGWTGTVHHDSPAGRHNARQEWDDEHALPLLAITIPPAITVRITELKAELAALSSERPAAAQVALQDLAGWAAQGHATHDHADPWLRKRSSSLGLDL